MEYKVGDKVMVDIDGIGYNVVILCKYNMVKFGFENLYDGKTINDGKYITFKDCEIKKEEVEEKKYLKTWEAIKALEEGYNVKHKDWIHNQYIYKNKEGQIISNRVGPVEIDNLDNEWLIYEEPKKEIPKEFEGLKYILGSINNMDCGDKDCDKCPLGMEKCDMLDEIFFDMKEKYNF